MRLPSTQRPVGLDADLGVRNSPAGSPCIQKYDPHQMRLGAVVDKEMSHSRPLGRFHREWRIQLSKHLNNPG